MGQNCRTKYLNAELERFVMDINQLLPFQQTPIMQGQEDLIDLKCEVFVGEGRGTVLQV